MPDWLTRLLESRIPTILDLLSNLWWALAVLTAGLLWVASRLGLWKRCGERDLRRWCSQLGHTDETGRCEAQRNLVRCGARSVFPLIDMLDETDSDTLRELIVDVLCQIGPSGLRPVLAIRREDSIAPFVDKVLESVLPKIVERQQRAQEHTSVWKQVRSCVVKAEPEQIVDRLIALLSDPDPVVQEGAALALGQYPLPKVVQGLGRRLYPTECKNAEVRKTVAESLGQTHQADAIPFLRIGLRDTSREVRISACRALSRIGQQEAIGVIADILLPFEEPSVRIEAAAALGHIGGAKAREILRRALENTPDDDDHRELRTVVGNEHAKLQRRLRGEEDI